MVQVVILAAGRGTRLDPMTNSVPKVMLKVGKKPILEHIIEVFKQYGHTDITIVVGYKKESIMDYFGNGSGFGVNISYVVQENYKGGTADAVRCVREKITDDKFLLIYGDNMFEPDIIKKMVKMSEKFDGVLCGKRVDKPELYGILETKGDVVTKIVEKPKKPLSNLAMTGLFILPRKIFSAIDETKLSPRGEYELTDSIQRLIDKGHTFGYVNVEDFWVDIGDKEQLIETEDYLKQR